MSDIPLRLLRWVVHVTTCLLLVIAVVAVLGEGRVAEALCGLVLGLAYAVGPALKQPWLRGAWLVLVTDGWMALASVAPPFVWLALPLLFVYLDLMPVWLAMFGVTVLTLAATLMAVWHAGEVSMPLLVGPSAAAAATTLLVLACKSLRTTGKAGERAGHPADERAGRVADA
ncbi:hypothetical protein [Nonomuraea jiangxiensis]|uniref:Uncharacterized protein n=1 Tax=Nonomuraea jiangxiensis TaxID=633440 RepID=A0A1G8LMT6_9ACTN|nr:hypothetical protein [Nonomuraea jiangxiensis]SDI56757.1 hypothetical protein SAMN05421869_106138 [Nonomuraea jiangxiensis]